jgi:hypothetical protein
MESNESSNLRISSPHVEGWPKPAGVNGCCHSWTAGVQPNSKHVIRSPRVMVILWGHYYETSSDAVAYATQLVTDLVTGPFMDMLCQYGVAKGSMAGTAVIDTSQLNPAPDTIDSDGIKKQLKQWFNANTIPAPANNEESLAYFIFPPTTTELTLDSLKGDVDFCGYHQWDTFNQGSTNPDVFFQIVSTKAAYANNTDPLTNTTDALAFVSALSPCVGHELAESFTDRDNQGYISTACTNPDGSTQTCEIGDICENKASFSYQRPGSLQTWNVEQYWSGWDNSCVKGNSPVSMKRFLSAINFDYQHLGLRSLGTPTINIQYVASRM